MAVALILAVAFTFALEEAPATAATAGTAAPAAMAAAASVSAANALAAPTSTTPAKVAIAPAAARFRLLQASHNTRLGTFPTFLLFTFLPLT